MMVVGVSHRTSHVLVYERCDARDVQTHIALIAVWVF